MATKIILKKSSTVGAIPLSTDLELGEVALNLADRKLYTKDNSNNVVQVGHPYVGTTAPTSPAEGDLWYDSANDALMSYDGTAWQSAGYQNFSELEDVTITNVAAGEIIKWDGSAFVNNTLAEADIQAASNTTADARSAISVTDAGGDGSLSYNSSTGVVTYTGPSAAETRAHFTGGTGIDLTAGDISVDFSEFDTSDLVEGTNLFYTDARFDSRLATKDTDDLAEGTNLYYTNERVDDRVGSLIVGGTNITATYDDTAGTLTIDQDATGGLNLSNNDTDDLSEGSTNLYYTTARARGAVSASDAGGDGSFTYNNATGTFTYTGPSAAETRAHFTGGTGVTITNGSVAIGQAVETTSDVTFNKVTTSTIEGGSVITIDPAGIGDNTGEVIIAGDLTVQGTTTSVNSNEVNIGDSVILLNADEAGVPSQNGGIEIERGTSANVSFVWNEADDAWDLNNETLQNVTIDGGTY